MVHLGGEGIATVRKQRADRQEIENRQETENRQEVEHIYKFSRPAPRNLLPLGSLLPQLFPLFKVLQASKRFGIKCPDACA